MNALTVPQTAALLQVSSDTVYRMVTEGKLPHFRAGRAIRFYEPVLREWMETESRTARRDPMPKPRNRRRQRSNDFMEKVTRLRAVQG